MTKKNKKTKDRSRNPRLDELRPGDVVRWQEQKTRVVGMARSGILVSLKLLPLEKAHAEKTDAIDQNREPRDVSFETRPIAAGLRVRRVAE